MAFADKATFAKLGWTLRLGLGRETMYEFLRVVGINIYDALNETFENERLKGALATDAIAKHGGVFIARGGAYHQLEGPDRPRNVVARFPSKQAAVDCYRSDDYQAALAHAKGAAERELVVVEELD